MWRMMGEIYDDFGAELPAMARSPLSGPIGPFLPLLKMGEVVGGGGVKTESQMSEGVSPLPSLIEENEPEQTLPNEGKIVTYYSRAGKAKVSEEARDSGVAVTEQGKGDESKESSEMRFRSLSR